MFGEFPDNQILENIPSRKDHDKAEQGSDECPSHHIVVLNCKIVLVVWIKLVDIRLHAQVGEGVDYIGNCHESSVQSVFRGCKTSLPGEEICIQKSQRKTKVYDARRKNALTPNGAHAEKGLRCKDGGFESNRC
jgi:hypothetical protein